MTNCIFFYINFSVFERENDNKKYIKLNYVYDDELKKQEVPEDVFKLDFQDAKLDFNDKSFK